MIFGDTKIYRKNILYKNSGFTYDFFYIFFILYIFIKIITKIKISNYLRILRNFIDALQNYFKYFGYQGPFNKLIIFNWRLRPYEYTDMKI